MASYHELVSTKEYEDVIASSRPSVVYFYKSWCSYCKKLDPVYESVSKSPEFKELDFYKANAEQLSNLASDLAPGPVPEVSVFANGIRKAKMVGWREQDEVEQWLRQALVVDPKNTSNLEQSPSHPTCQGRFEERGKRHTFFGNSKPFNDVESGCVFQPSPDRRGLLISRANEGSSSFSTTVWTSPDDAPNKIFFGIHFMPDPSEKARFESALFSVTFGHDDAEGKHLPLNILDLAPQDTGATVSRTFFSAAKQTSEPANADPDTEMDVVNSGTATTVHGQGVNTATAVWTFEEAEERPARQGLDAHYTLTVTVPETVRVWMKFWGKAVLSYGDGSRLNVLKRGVTLKAGTMETPFTRVLDLSITIQNAHDERESVFD